MGGFTMLIGRALCGSRVAFDRIPERGQIAHRRQVRGAPDPARVDARLAGRAEVRDFAGMEDAEIAAALNPSSCTDTRDRDQSRRRRARALRG